ncbi:magnesium transporter CorA family protein [Porphyromonas loveana]|uniref:Magnesium transporter n=1 Tax=Porphyromonas loveana TaxID=1884669 RepID=A0A2U1F936_9PORP|nr:magnesium transporter CorA family protein [Porphyromonas loveana]PVZ08692.1 magnesium transporter [Porphyromonas loveana]
MRKYLFAEQGFVEKPEFDTDCWVCVEAPDTEDMKFLIDKIEVPEDFLSDIADADERPRIEHDGEWMLAIIRIPIESHLSGVPYVTVPMGIATKAGVTVSICYHRAPMLADFLMHTRRKRISVLNRMELILRLIYSSAVWFLKYLKQINNEVTISERELERSIRNEDLIRLMMLQKTLVYFSTSIRGNEAVLGKVRASSGSPLDKELVEDVQIELRQAYNTVNIYSDILSGTTEALSGVISNNLNTVMKRMTTISIVLMLPTLIASFYGMNVPIMGSSFPFSFFIIIGACVLLSAVAFLFFKKIKWF